MKPLPLVICFLLLGCSPPRARPTPQPRDCLAAYVEQCAVADGQFRDGVIDAEELDRRAEEAADAFNDCMGRPRGSGVRD